jgi:hypothetical protein
MTASAEISQLLLFTLVWTAIWVAPLPRLGRRAELVAGLIPFAAFGMRVFAGFFVGVPEDDPVRSFVRPLLDWIGGQAGFPPFSWVLDGTVALGLVWLASAFGIPHQSRLATAWIMPAVAALASGSLWTTGLPLERLLALTVPAIPLACAVGSALAAVIRWTPSPIPIDLRRQAAIIVVVALPAAVGIGLGALRLTTHLPHPRVSQAESVLALVVGAGAAAAGWVWGGFRSPRSRFLYAMAVGVAAGALVALYA